MPIEKTSVSLMDAKRLREERAPIVKRMQDILENAKLSGNGLSGSAKEQWEKLDQEQRSKLELAQAIEEQNDLEGIYDDESIRQSLGRNGVGFGNSKWVAENEKGKQSLRTLPPDFPIVYRNSQQTFSDVVNAGLSDKQKRQDQINIGDYIRAVFGSDRISPEQRAMVEGTGSAGGYTVPTILSAQLVDYITEQSVAMKAGCGIVPLDQTAGSFKYASIKTLPTVGWLAEAASSTTYDFTLGQVTFSPKTCRTIVVCSRELMEDSINMSQAINKSLQGAFADAIDKAVLEYTTDANRPKSIRDSTELTHAYAGGSTTIVECIPRHLARGLVALQQNNVDWRDVTGIVMPTQLWSNWIRAVDSLGQPLGMVDVLATLRNVIYPSNRLNKCVLNLPTSDSNNVIMGNFNNVGIGVRKNLSIIPINERYVDQNLVAFFAYLRADVQVFNYKSLLHLDGFSTAEST